MMARDDGWDVYVIHNPKDTPRVRQLVTQWRELGLRVFFREDSIPLGADAGRARETALKGSRRVVFMISPAALTEELANQETGIALFLDPAANQRLLLPVIIEPTLEDSIPLTIRRLYPADLTDPVQRRDEYHRLLRTLLGDDRRDLPDLPDPLEGDGAGGVKPPPYVLPRRPACFGRDAEVGALVGTLLEDSPPPTPILGGPGMGKTTVTLAALYDPRVVERFGSRRFFVRCDSARTGADVVAFVGNALGVPIGPHREPLVIAELARAPAVLVLDNLETPWEADGAGTEAVLDGLAAVPGLVLVASIRGAERPAGGWRERITIERLELPAARDAFLAVAGREKFAADPLLDDLLVTVADRVPLAVVLLAHFSEPQPNLTPVWNEWQARGPDILQRLKGDHRLLSIAFSVEVSISSPRMNDPARRLLRLLGVLPDGIAWSDLAPVLRPAGPAPPTAPQGGGVMGRLRRLLDFAPAAPAHPQPEPAPPPSADAAARSLRAVGLAYDEAERLRVLAPVRAYLRKYHHPAPAELAPAIAHYSMLASSEGRKAGREGGDAAIRRLAAEVANLDAIILAGLDLPDPRPSINTTLELWRFFHFSGLGTARVMEKAREVAITRSSALVAANCTFCLAVLAFDRSNHERAQSLFEEALPLYRRVWSVHGQANCIQGLGDIALACSDHEQARARYEEALPRYARVGDVLGQANCIYGLGGIALACSDHEQAQARYEEALALSTRVGSVLGQANCIKGLGDLAFRQSDHEQARARYEQALTLLTRVGSVRGQASCIQGLGDIALRRSNPERARAWYEQALSLYARVGDVLGQANCIFCLGVLAFLRSDLERARFEEALALYIRVGSVLGQANCIKSLGDIALARSDHEGARSRYEAALPLYVRVGSVQGQANCIHGLGDIALGRSDHEEARAKFDEALALYNRIQEPYSIGWAHVRLARMAADPDERRRHARAAREAWVGIDRGDLVERHLGEFGDLD